MGLHGARPSFFRENLRLGTRRFLRFSAKIEGLAPVAYAILRSSSAACAFFSYFTSVAAILSR
jgi:hypothetical protein